MRLIALDVLCLFLITWNGIICKEVTTCSKILYLHCNKYQLVIQNVNTTSNLVVKILEQCNAHHQCNVTNLYGECVRVIYWCRMNFPILEMKNSSNNELYNKSTLFGLMSEGYDEGEHQQAENFMCNLTFFKKENPHQISFKIREFAPYSSSLKFCLWIENYLNPTICSGSRKINTSYGYSVGRNKLHFILALAETAESVPKVRFWIDIYAGNLSENGFHLVCSSHPVRISAKSFGLTVILPMSVLSAFLLVVVTVWLCRMNHWKCSTRCFTRNSTYNDNGDVSMDECHGYDYITAILDRDGETCAALGKSTCQVTAKTQRKDKMNQRVMSMKSNMKNADSLSRYENAIHGREIVPDVPSLQNRYVHGSLTGNHGHEYINAVRHK